MTLYGDYLFGDGMFMAGQLGYGQSDVERNRYNVAGVSGQTANAEYDMDQFFARFEIGRDYLLDNGLIVTPSLMANYALVDSDSFTETGAGAFNLNEDPDSNSSFEVGPSVTISGQVQQANGDYLKPHLVAGYRYEFLQDEVETTASFTGAGGSFTAQGYEPEEHRFNIGTGLTYMTTTNWEFKVDYNYDFREDYEAHSGFVRAAYRF